ncbi:Mitochondrial basic amino acids transporter-like protein [Hapsidospora chrysogenum ATCC 11550]|uniref:Mitochondrial basic amino acids transporter-like protein n=1 Tax=Hapsidospora chrysogenum (strain ATCC 11550 / CBS 779.69 / DSM 880 / IAM 14645 / JCM 23072 / IMI 49137) TaxID=857340 RepID=A0A086SW34_HAPC1|nr:Mitochondrial basic amino acids transporter-like protein [Hapsidospora chrysogenum ATCC 11550]
MSADFWAGYLSGALGIVVGNPLDLIKVRLQASNTGTTRAPLHTTAALTTGTAAPIMGYGALNALLFVSYNRCEAGLNEAFSVKESLTSTWLAGALGGLATWVVSAPTELVKCRAQASRTPLSSRAVAWRVFKEQGIRGFYAGGVVTALRDSIGYGFYFWSYQLATGLWPTTEQDGPPSFRHEAPKVLLCGGIAGIATWASIFPLDVIKTRVQTQALEFATEASPLLDHDSRHSHRDKRSGAWQVAKDAYRAHGLRVFFRGFGVCCARAFIVNAVQWAAYEAIMRELGQEPK